MSNFCVFMPVCHLAADLGTNVQCGWFSPVHLIGGEIPTGLSFGWRVRSHAKEVRRRLVRVCVCECACVCKISKMVGHYGELNYANRAIKQ